MQEQEPDFDPQDPWEDVGPNGTYMIAIIVLERWRQEDPRLSLFS